MRDCKLITVEQNHQLYNKGDSSDFFYFVLRGQLHLMVTENNQNKFSKTVDEGTFFGMKEIQNQERNDFANASQANTEVLVFNSIVYKNIITKTLQSQADRKVDFLLRYGPKLREAGRQMV
jgi:CRP-like cAMP-binding protein